MRRYKPHFTICTRVVAFENVSIIYLNLWIIFGRINLCLFSNANRMDRWVLFKIYAVEWRSISASSHYHAQNCALCAVAPRPKQVCRPHPLSMCTYDYAYDAVNLSHIHLIRGENALKWSREFGRWEHVHWTKLANICTISMDSIS